MSGSSAVAVALATIAAAVVAVTIMTRARHEVTATAAAYTLNGRNVEWPCASVGNAFAETGRYVAKNIIATRVQVWADRAFVLTPRFRSGVPFTVSAVRLDCRDRCWPVLSPYPRWSLHDDGDPNAIQNAVDMYLDPEGILWLLDSGLVDTAERPVRRAKPKILAVDVKIDKVSHLIK